MPNARTSPTVLSHLRPALLLTLALCLLTGFFYPGLVTALAQLLFPAQSNGSLVRVDGRVVGSALIGQTFTKPEYFHSRPSAAGGGYDALASGGSNKGPLDSTLNRSVLAARVQAVRENAGGDVRAVPSDAVTASGSGLDPHISPAYALIQLPRIANARGMSVDELHTLVKKHTEDPQFGVFGDPRVNVLLLNVSLDAQYPLRSSPHTPLP